jgi:hypothetical protein
LIKYRESRISAHHNFLVNGMLSPGFSVGDPSSKEGFYFLANPVPPAETTPRISARLMDEQGALLVELNWNSIGENPGGCTYHSIVGGFTLSYSSGKPLLEVVTQNFTNGHLTRIKATLFDERGDLRMETVGESIQVNADTILHLETPFVLPL